MGDLKSICYQRIQNQLYNVPPVRITPSNPYQTQQQILGANYDFNIFNNKLNMRRKAEVLSYKKTQQTSGITKKEMYSKITNPTFGNKILTCPNDTSIPTASSACDVPGPITYIFKDNSVPLYNYASNTESYAITNSGLTDEWKFYPIPDILLKPYISTAAEKTIARIIVSDYIESSYLTFNFSIPIAIYASGRDDLYNNFDISFNISNPPICHIYFSNNLITTVNPVITYPNNTVSIHGSSINTVYSAYIYYGMITVSNLKLYTDPGFVYDIRMTLPMNILTSNSNVASNSVFGIYCNLSQDSYNSIISTTTNSYSPKNCTINGQLNNVAYSPSSAYAQ
jgi:hypothetical protein